MKQSLRIAGGVAAVLLVVGRAASAQPPSTPIVIHLSNGAGVAIDVVQATMAYVDQIFGDLGVAVQWAQSPRPAMLPQGPAAAGRHVAVDLLETGPATRPTGGDHGQRLEADAHVLGVAAPSCDRAFVFVDRLTKASVRYPVEWPAALAHVIAHEIGHLLLPEGHSSIGIMRPSIDLRAPSARRFTDDEAQSIRAALADKTNH